MHGILYCNVLSLTVRPEVVIRPRTGEDRVKDISVKWELDGKPTSLHVATDIKPNHDLTYQLHKTIFISGTKHNYSCCVEHSSLPEPLQIDRGEIKIHLRSTLNQIYS